MEAEALRHASMIALGVDIGGSWVRVGMGDSEGRIMMRSVSSVDSSSKDAFTHQIGDLISRVAGARMPETAGIGIGAAGRLDIKRGMIVYSPQNSLRDIPIREILEDRFKKPVCLLNDCVAAVLAEKAVGAGRGERNIVYVGFGTGIGGGMVVDGHVLLGKEGNAHEVGHMIIDVDGKLECSCGGRGHWEAYTSGSGLPRLARHMAEYSQHKTAFMERAMAGGFGAKDIFGALAEGDAFASSVLHRAAEINSMAFANLADLYDPRIISIGGGLAMKNPGSVIAPIAELLPKYSFNTPPSVVATPLGEDAQLLGAILSNFEDVRM